MSHKFVLTCVPIFLIFFTINSACGQEQSNTIIAGQLFGDVSIYPQKTEIKTGENDTISPYGNITTGISPFIYVWEEIPPSSQVWQIVASGQIYPNQNQDYNFQPDENLGVYHFRFLVYDANHWQLVSNVIAISVEKEQPPSTTPITPLDSEEETTLQTIQLNHAFDIEKAEVDGQNNILETLTIIGGFIGFVVSIVCVWHYRNWLTSRPIEVQYTPEGIFHALTENPKLRTKVVSLICPEPAEIISPPLQNFVEEISRRYQTTRSLSNNEDLK